MLCGYSCACVCAPLFVARVCCSRALILCVCFSLRYDSVRVQVEEKKGAKK